VYMFVKQNVYKTRWGREIWLHNSEKYAFKVMEFKAGGRDGLHFHASKTETWFVKSGIFEVTTVDATTGKRVKRVAEQGDALHFPVGVPHGIHCLARGRILKASTENADGDRHSLRTRF
jgi:quercetin dioxygenase-like cupin family protein